MFAENRPYRIRFQLPEGSRGKITSIRNINFDDKGIYTFEGMLAEYEAVKKFLGAYGVVPLDTPDTSETVERPVPQGIGKQKLAIVAGARDDLDDLSEFRPTTNATSSRPAPEGDRQPPSGDGARAEGAAGVRHGSGAGQATGSTQGALPSGEDGVRAEDQVSAEDFKF